MIWFQNLLHVEGPPVLVTEFFNQGRDTEIMRGAMPHHYKLRFSKFVPRPAALDVSECAAGLDGYTALYGDYTKLLVDPRIRAVGATTREAVCAFLDWTNPQCRRLAERYADNEQRYGHRTWLTWNRMHYGPKWDLDTTTQAQRRSLTDLVYQFRTLEVQPWPWLTAVKALYPALAFDLRLSAAAPRVYLKAV